MPRNLVLCFDGTKNLFGQNNTNVVRLAQVLDRRNEAQRLYYDPGVGTLPEPNALTAIRKRLSEAIALAFGVGLNANVEEAYAYLMNFWEPDDVVFLFGFSRGAYTARVLAAMLHGLGLLPAGQDHLVPYVMKLFKSIRDGVGDDEASSKYWTVCREFRRTFAREATPGDEARHFRVHFVGVWDTVSSVGWVWDPRTFPYTARNPSVSIVRQAIAIDERRAFFRQNLFRKVPEQDLQERWFPGVHADVGGGYPLADGHLWRAPFVWIVDEARRAGLRIDDDRLTDVIKGSTEHESWKGTQHESLKGAWWLGEAFPKWQWMIQSRRRRLRVNLGRHRSIPNKAEIDRTALLRVRMQDYAPPNLPIEFLDEIRRLTNVPDSLSFERSNAVRN
jgi:uncharacterized protein (DUF2235 family)